MLEDAGLESEEQQQIGRNARATARAGRSSDDWRTRIYENSLLLAMTAVFFATWFAPVAEQLARVQRRAARSTAALCRWAPYLGNADFWERTLENWQSEFLAVGTIVVFTIYLRQRGSPESKPVGAPHDETASSG